MCERHTSDVKQEQPKLSTRQKKLWELENYYHCSIIGTCLNLAELRQLARKAKISAPSPLNDYELHVIFVNLVKEPGPISRLVQKHLNRKYQRALQQLNKTPSPQDMTTYWKAAITTGDVAGAFWVLLTNPQTPHELLGQIYGEIHMLSHLAGASIRVDMQELNQLRHRRRRLEKQLSAEQSAARRKI
ncbi:MAG: hypothetical protein V2J55_20510, partial [Candidatus Competibacteraceae bacterium]|nr:hypothetical protein [Candidatus Competibacteraceae bacterium]